MTNSNRQASALNAQKILTSLAKVMLNEDFSFSEFNELARKAFVDAAEGALADEKRVTDSRISILTGIHRKDVKRLRGKEPGETDPERVKSNRAVAVISAWAREADYCTKAGAPLPLAYDDEAPSLTTLIQTYSGDMPVRAVCDELERMGVIEKREDRWHLLMPAYVPNKSRDAVFNFLGEETSHLLNTFQHNLKEGQTARRFQRSVTYDELTPETVELFQTYSSERSMELLKDFDTWLSKKEKNDKRQRKQQPDTPRFKAGVGIYYFEEDLTDESAGENS